MIDTSRAYKDAVAGIEGNREFCIADKITFADGAQLPLSLEDVFAYSINDATTQSGKFQIGAAIIKEYSVTLNNFDKKFSGCSFKDADVTADIGIKLPDGTWEILRKGTFRVVKAREIERSINVTAYDSMLFFDRPYSESTLSYPASIQQIVQNACTDCQVVLDVSTVQMGDYIVQERPQDDALTYRDIISYCAQVMGCYARINRLGMLEFSWYEFGITGIINAGIYYENENLISGGTFENIPEDIACASFDAIGEYHHLYNLKTKSIDTDDIVISGIRIIPEVKDQNEQITVDYGTDGYMIIIEQNPLIQNAADAQSVAQYVGRKIVGNQFRTYNVTTQSDPSREAGDTVMISTGSEDNSISSIITNTTFSIGGAQKTECTAETPTEKSYTKYGAQTRILAKSKQETERQMSAYEVAFQQMNQLAANTMGFFATTKKQVNGSVIAYRHDKPDLSESKIVYKSGIDGFWVTQDFQGTDAATAAAGKWKAGFDSNGNAVLNLLSVIGINFNWAHGGTLTLGGNGNGDGIIDIRSASGMQIGHIDNTGVHFNQGEFSGTLKAAVGTFAGVLSAATGTFGGTVKAGKVEGSEISGSLIKSYDEDDNGIENDGGTQRFYWNGLQFGTMKPDSDFIVDETTGEAIETSYLYYDCSIMVKECYSYSDERRKDITDWNNSYDDLLMDLVPIQFSWKDGNDKRVHTGIGARTTKRLLKKHNVTNSALVSGHEETALTVGYSDLHAIEIASIQKSRKMILELEKEISQLKKQLEDGG